MKNARTVAAVVVAGLGLAAACRAPEVPPKETVVVVPARADARGAALDAETPDASKLPRAARPVLPTPTAVTIRADSPFAVEVGWEYTSEARPNGFEVLAVRDKGDTRLALADPKDRAFAIHGLLPEGRLEVRVRAFDAHGASKASESAVVTTPKEGKKKPASAMPPCIPKVTAPPPTTGGCNPGLEVIDATKGLVNVPSASDACRRRLLGTYAGCTRELGAFVLQADVTEVPGYATEGFPLLHAIAGAGEYVGAQIHTLSFEKGRYGVVDTVHYCGEQSGDSDESAGIVEDDVRKCRPPFEACQYGAP